MRALVIALILAFGAVSAVSSTIAAYAVWGKSASTPESLENDDSEKTVFHDVCLKCAKKARTGR